jgi:NADPH:quinone reductase-like Zn-dependent oxidoreductase
MKGLVLDARWDPKPDYRVSDWEKEIGKAAGRLDLSPIITVRYDLQSTVDAIAKSTERADGKILVKPNWISSIGTL